MQKCIFHKRGGVHCMITKYSMCKKGLQSLQISGRQERFVHFCIYAFVQWNFGIHLCIEGMQPNGISLHTVFDKI